MFSVVIPNYNRVNELYFAIESVLNQNGVDKYLSDIIVVDDNSNNIDEIEGVISSFNDYRIKLIRNYVKNNAAATRNQGARASTGKWICFLDSDDRFLDGKFVELEKSVISNSDVYYNKAAVYFNSSYEKTVPNRPLLEGETIGDYLFVAEEILQTSTLTIKKSFFELSGFNEKYIRHQDYDLVLTFEQMNLKLEFVDFVGTAIFWSSNTRFNIKGETYQYSERWLNENRYRLSDKAIACFYFKFIIMRAAQSRQKKYSISKLKFRHLFLVKRLSLIKYSFIILIPSWFHELCYKVFKNLNCSMSKLTIISGKKNRL